MNISQLSRVRRMFFHDMAPKHVARHNARKWCQMVRFLGDRWKAIPVVNPNEPSHAKTY